MNFLRSTARLPATRQAFLSGHSRRLATATTELPLTTATEASSTPSASNAASISPSSSSSLVSQSQTGSLRPHLGVATNPNHGLYAFFRRTSDEPNSRGEMVPGKHIMVEPAHAKNDKSGRSWTAMELRRKSFQDLHTLWYILARERNLIATQIQSARRIGVAVKEKALFSGFAKDAKCRKSMAHIKQVLNERRLAYIEASRIVEERAKADSTITEAVEEIQESAPNPSFDLPPTPPASSPLSPP